MPPDPPRRQGRSGLADGCQPVKSRCPPAPTFNETPVNMAPKRYLRTICSQTAFSVILSCYTNAEEG